MHAKGLLETILQLLKLRIVKNGSIKNNPNWLLPKLHAFWISLKIQSLQFLNNATIVIQGHSPAGFD